MNISNEPFVDPVKHCIPKFVEPVIDNIARTHFNGEYVIDLESGSNVGDGFIGLITRVRIRSQKDETQPELRLICKHLCRDPMDKESLTIMDLFLREIFVYKEMLPEFEKFQKDKNISEDEGFFSFPKCYLAHYDEESEQAALVFEDLRTKGYQMKNKYECPGYDHSRLLMIHLGRMHAVCLAMKEQVPDIFEKFKKLDDVITKFMQRSMLQFLPPKNLDLLCSVLNEDQTEEHNFFQAWKSNMWSAVSELVTGDIAEPYSVITHGDCWINNQMFTYGPSKDIPEKICLLDWQMCRYGSPVLDFAFFIFTCTKKPLRDRSYDELLSIFYESLSQLLERLGGDANRQFPKSVLQDHLKRFGGQLGMAMATFTTPLVSRFITGYSTEDEYAVVRKYQDEYTDRMQGLVQDFVKLGCLPKNE